MKFLYINKKIVNKKGLIVLLMLFFILPAMAQSFVVTGTVTDAKGEELPGVTVRVKGESNGTITDIKGKYSIRVPLKSNELIFTYVGYVSKTISIPKNSKTLNVVLEEDVKTLGEVVVVGYGQMRKSDLTGAISSVSVNDVETMTSTNIQSLLQGRAAGVQVTASDAAPGAAINMKIRGTGSLTGSSEPLYVVDGIIMNSTMDQNILSGESGTTAPSQNGLTGINPQDIESFEVLKDASATAIYGSLGANGVVLITTKSGKTEKPKMQYTGSVSTSHITNKRDLMTLEEYIPFKNELGLAQGSSKLQNLVIDGKIPVDWQDWATRQAWSHSHRMNISGKTDKTKYYVSGGYNDLQGVIRSTGSKAMDIRINFDQEVSSRLRIGTRTSFMHSKLNMTSGSNASAFASSGLLRQILTFRPYRLVAGSEDDYIDENEGVTDMDSEDAYGPNPYLKDYEDFTKEYRVLSSVYLDIKLVKWLSMRTTVGVDYRYRTRQQYYGVTTSNGRNNGGMSQVSNKENMRLNIDHMFNANYRFGKNRLEGTLGVTATTSTDKNRLNVGRSFSVLGFREEGLMYSGTINPPQYTLSPTNSLSFLGRVIYNYDERYVLTATFRADGTSKFAPENRFSYFPSFALAYRLDQENFFRKYRWLSNAKIRLGWGMVGNQNITPYQTLQLYGSNTYSNALGSGYYAGFELERIANPTLKWETTQQYNVGFDLGLLRNRINFTVDLYNKSSYDLLQNIEMPLSSGYSRMYINRGSIRNRGIEISLDLAPVRTKKYSLNIGGNISFNKNKIMDIGLEQSQIGANNWAYFLGTDVGNASYFKHAANIFIEGRPVALFYGLKTSGILTQAEVDEDRRVRMQNFLAVHPTVSPDAVTKENLMSVRGTLPIWSGTQNELLEAGDFRYFDADGNGYIEADADRTIIGDPNPKFTYGFTVDFTYQDFFVNAVFNGVYGNQIANSNRMLEEDIKTIHVNYNATRYIRDHYWREDRISTTDPRMNYAGDAGRFSSYYVEDGSFLRFANLTIGYNINLRRNKFISRVGLSLTGTNLFVITKYRGYDPEVNSFANDPFRVGVDWTSYPKNRTYALGVTLDF
ncbi:SusC/RagA family TonB-linked outer membrane protein [Coprobacter secundus]|uniref:SusC/RagA family TonB-linked outer membrane protein n=1 Tax=Coprobacter secundus subsp. similis TaxID=2751153 RepID=A0A7G1HW62_9BACT|nr:TonB-dependent receptor [Coprobacter secundus]BCI63936.1 SusC/RagA family TonB-linked outer membrane protein [Coprobacter secundus subsp. similis]